MDAPDRTTAPPVLPVANAPCSFGVDEIVPPDAWMPEPDEMLDWMVELDYAGTELGPPGYLGDGPTTRRRLAERGLRFVGSFLPQRFSHAECVEEDRAWLRQSLELIREATSEGSRPFAVLADGLDEPVRQRWSGAIEAHPEAWLSAERFETFVANLHRAAELCREAGFDVVIHPHAGTYLETAGEIERLMERLDPSLLGLCLDTGHFRFGGADPTASVHAYASLLRHVHLKDCSVAVLDEVRRSGLGFAEAVNRGVFVDLGQGDSGIAEVVGALREHDYRGWVVVEQDMFLDAADTRESIVASQRRNRAYLRGLGL
ncbi:MAG TPA: TIM barrel protein [Candidatus Limnocylindrales bacterium]